ncbi:MAG: hypothetical protein ABI443_07260 [Chthoniobacterales bacterium]
MGRQRLLTVSAFLFSASLAFAQSASDVSHGEASPSPRHPGAAVTSGQKPLNLPEHIKDRLDKMPPAERAKFLENFHHWQQMTNEEKHYFRECAMMERQKIQEAANAALQKSGLTLDKDRSEAFALRYMQERRKIERSLHQELEAKRVQLLEGVIEKLKIEFSTSVIPKKEDATVNSKTCPQPASTP